MSLQTLMKTVRFVCSFKQNLPLIHYASNFFRHRLKFHSKISCLAFLPSATFGTSVKYCGEESFNEMKSQLVTSVEDPTQPLVHFTVITKSGEEIPMEARVGMTIMAAVIKHDDSLIEATCGGELACTTCHVFCKEKETYFTPVSETEQDLLDAVPCSTSDSRLCCQMKITKEFENVQIYLPTDSSNYFPEGRKK